MLFHFDIENAITDDHSFHIEAQDLMEAHVKALEFVRELDAEIKKRTDGAIDADLKLTNLLLDVCFVRWMIKFLIVQMVVYL